VAATAQSLRQQRLRSGTADAGYQFRNHPVTAEPNSPPTTLPMNHTAAARTATQMRNLSNVDACRPDRGALLWG
jgi:hypothetical protein